MPGLDAHRIDSMILDGYQRPPIYDPRRDAKIIVKMDGNADNYGDPSYLTAITGTPTYVTGKFGQCYSAKDATQIELDTGKTLAAGEFTVAMWVNLDSTYTTYRRAIWYGDDSRYLGVEINSSYQYTLAISNVGGVNQTMWAGFGTTSGWTLLTWRKWSNGHMAVQINNRPSQTVCGRASSLTGTITAPFTLSHPTYQYDGLIDETYIWNRTLTEDEIAYIYNGGAGRAA